MKKRKLLKALFLKSKTHKYIKRLPKSNGKGFIYFYDYKQLKEYKDSQKQPEEKKTSFLSGIMSFFGLKTKEETIEKIKTEYDKNKSKLENISINTFSDYLNEYLSNKDKWDKRLKKSSVAKLSENDNSTKTENSEKEKTVSSEKKKSQPKKTYKLSIMRKIADIANGFNKENKESVKSNENVINISEKKRSEISLDEKKDDKKRNPIDNVSKNKEILKQYTLDDDKKLLLGSESKVSSKLYKNSDNMVNGYNGVQSFLADNIKEKGFYTNGRILVVDKNLAGKMFEKARSKHKNKEFPKVSQIDIDRLIPKNYDNCVEAEFSFALQDNNKSKTSNQMIYNFRDEKVVFNASFINLFKKNFPDGKLLVSGKMEPAYYMVGNELKGIIMPIQNNKGELEDLEKKIPNLKEQKDDFEKHNDKIKANKDLGIYSPEFINKTDGSFRTRISQGKIDLKNIKDEKEKKLFNNIKVTNLTNEENLLDKYDFSKEGQDAGVWTNTRIMILDKKITDKIYNTNKQNELLRTIKNIGKDFDIKQLIDNIENKAKSLEFTDYKKVIPDENDISKNRASFTGKYSDSKVPIMEFSDGNQSLYFDANEIATLRSMFPDSKLYFTSETSPAVFKVNNKIKAVLMPRLKKDFEFNNLEKAVKLLKGKRAQVGEVRTFKNGKFKKDASGKWIPVSDKNTGSSSNNNKNRDKNKDKKKKDKNFLNNKAKKEAFKNAIRSLVDTLSGIYQGTGGANEATGTVKQSGSDIEKVGEERKENKKLKIQNKINNQNNKEKRSRPAP